MNYVYSEEKRWGYGLKGQNEDYHLSSYCCRISVKAILLSKGKQSWGYDGFSADDHLKGRC